MSKLLPTKVADVIQVNGECLYFAGYVPQAPDTDVSQVQAQFNTCGECEGGSSLILPGDAGFSSALPEELSSLVVDPSSHLSSAVSSAQAAVDTGTSDCSACNYTADNGMNVAVYYDGGCSGTCFSDPNPVDESGASTFAGTNFFTFTGFDAYVELFCSGANQWECTVFVCNCVNEQYFASGVGEVVALTCGPNYPTGTVIIPIVDSNTGAPSGNATVTFS